MKLESISLSSLHPSDQNPRVIDEFSPAIVELSMSIKAHGLLVPLIVRPNGTGFTILAGHRRHVAAGMAGLRRVPCVIRREDGPRAVEHLVENVARHDLTPAEIGRAVHAALSTRKIKQRDLAIAIGKSEPWVSRYKVIGRFCAAFAAGKHAVAPDSFTNGDRLYEAANAFFNPVPVPVKVQAAAILPDSTAAASNAAAASTDGQPGGQQLEIEGVPPTPKSGADDIGHARALCESIRARVPGCVSAVSKHQDGKGWLVTIEFAKGADFEKFAETC